MRFVCSRGPATPDHVGTATAKGVRECSSVHRGFHGWRRGMHQWCDWVESCRKNTISGCSSAGMADAGERWGPSPNFLVFCSKLRCSSRALKSLRRGNCGSIQTRIRPVNSLFVAPLAPLCGPHWLAAKRLKTSGITPSSVTSVCSCPPAWAVRLLPNLSVAALRFQDKRTKRDRHRPPRFNVRRPARGCARW